MFPAREGKRCFICSTEGKAPPAPDTLNTWPNHSEPRSACQCCLTDAVPPRLGPVWSRFGFRVVCLRVRCGTAKEGLLVGHGVKIGLALAAGGARGAAHAGVLKVLHREGIEISAIAGTSIGAIVGGALAAGVSVARIEQEWLDTGLPKVARSFLPTFPRAGLSSGGELCKYLRALLGDRRIEHLSIPFAAVACDFDTGEAIVLKSGSLVDAMRASASIPGIFFPVWLDGRLLVDGGLVDPLPVRECRQLGADVVIGVDIVPTPQPSSPRGHSVWERLGQHLHDGMTHQAWIPANLTEHMDTLFRERPEAQHPLPGMYSIVNQSISILLQEVLRLHLLESPADLVIRPTLNLTTVSYLRAADGIRAGEAAAEEALPQLRALLSKTETKRA